MKPHLKRFNGLWHCGLVDGYGLGIGYTAVQAYDDWLLMELKR